MAGGEGYSLEIFLMHMWFIASIRSVLIRIGITSFYVNFALDFVVSMFAPVLAMRIIDRMKLKDILVRPTKFVKKSEET